MPRVRRKSKSRREGVGIEHVYFLLNGGWFIRPFPLEEDVEAQRELWAEMRDELLATWIEHAPGTRPWAWWTFDAPERRLCLNGVHPHDDPAREAHIERMRREYGNPQYGADRSLYYGCPRFHLRREDFEAKYETQRQYLERLGLLDESERDAVGINIEHLPMDDIESLFMGGN